MKKDRASVPLDEVFAKSEKDPRWKLGSALADHEVRLATRIHEARQKGGLTQRQLADAVGTTQSVISRIEKADQNMTVGTLVKLADALHMNLSIELAPRARAKDGPRP